MTHQPITNFQLTDEQQTICEAVRETTSHVMVDALAGTGKTETLCQAAKGVKGFALALAFNKKIAEELTRRLPPNFEAKTMNSLGFSELRRAKPGVSKWNVDDRKADKILREQAKASGGKLSGDAWTQTLELVRAAQLAGLTSNPDEHQNWDNLMQELWIDEDDQEETLERALKVLIKNNLLTETGLISFDDQLYWPVVYSQRFVQHEVVFGDEAQDWNWLQHQLVEKISKRGRLVIAGDPRQSIYGWRGARSDSMGELRETHQAREWIELGLTMTWRCPKRIVERQLRHVPRYRVSDDAIEGEVHRIPDFGEDVEVRETWSMKDLAELRPTPHSTIAVLCRNNAPLWKLAFSLLRQRVAIVMQGRDLGKMLIALSRKIEPDDLSSKDKFLLRLQDWEEKQRARAGGDEERSDAVNDRAECLRVVAEWSTTAGEIRRNIEDLFARTTGTITLSTIHRAKGLEWDMVVHLDPWRVPSKQARKQGGEVLVQEQNLLYVCETRTKHTLVLANVEDFQ